MNSYEKIHDLLLEACFVSEQKGRAQGRKRLAATAAVLGGLTAGLQGTGKASMPNVPKPSISVAKSSDKPSPPSLPVTPSREVATKTSEKPAPESAEQEQAFNDEVKRILAKRKYDRENPVETPAERKARHLKLQRSIDQEQLRIDFDKRQGRSPRR